MIDSQHLENIFGNIHGWCTMYNVSCKSSQRCKLPWTRSKENARTSQTTLIMSNDEIPESDLYASFIILLSSLFVWVLPKYLFWLSDVTLFETVRVEARDFYRMIVQRSGITVRINKTKTICILPSNSAVCKIKVLLQNACIKAKLVSHGKQFFKLDVLIVKFCLVF